MKDALADLHARHGGRPPEPRQSALAATVARMPGHDDGQRRPGKDYNQVAALLAEELRAAAEIPRRRAQDGAWCLWETIPAIAEETPLLERYLRQLVQLADRRASRALCNVYLLQFREDRPGLKRVSLALEELSSHAAEPYADLQRALALFRLPDGPERLGAEAVRQRRSPLAVLQMAGITSEQLLRGGFVEPCVLAALRRLVTERTLSARERLDLVKALAIDPRSGGLAFPKHKAAVADALLLPYAKSDPPEEIKTETLNLVTNAKVLGDPRTNPWLQMDDAKAVALRWLTRLALRQFLDVVGAINPNANWKYRRRFWEAMYENGAIGNAWTVLSTRGIEEARRRFGTSTPYGRFVSGTVAGDQAVLLIEVGRGICAEWSYNGQCRFWADRTRSGAPEMFQSVYDADFLRTGKAYAPVEEIRHMPHEGFTAWQHKAARRIHSMTGVRVHERDYML